MSKEKREGDRKLIYKSPLLRSSMSNFPLCYLPSHSILCYISPPVFSFPLPPHLLPLHSSTSFLSQSLLFMKVNLQVYQELLAGGGLRCSNHNKALPSTWNRKSIVGILGYFHCHTLHTIAHSHLPLSANEHPCFLPASFPKALLSPSCSSQVVHCFVFFFFFYYFFFFSSLTLLHPAFFIGLQGAVIQWWAPLFNQHMSYCFSHTAVISQLTHYIVISFTQCLVPARHLSYFMLY